MSDLSYQRDASEAILARKWDRLAEIGRFRSTTAPTDPTARLLIITGALFRGDYREAHASHATLFALPDTDEAAPAALLHDQGETIRAFAARLAQEHPDNPGARLFFGLTLAQLGDLESALQEYKDSLRLAADDAFAHYFYGQALHALDRLDMAIREYREAVRLAPQDVRMRLNLGSAYYEQGILEAAIAQYREAIKLNPSDPFLHYNLGVALADQGRFEPAIAAYKESARLNPADALVHYALGMVQETRGRSHEAIAAFEQSIRLAPTLAVSHAKLGWLFYKQNKIPQALESFERAVQYHDDDPQTLHGLGLAKLVSGKKDEAIDFLKQAYQKEEREDKKKQLRGVLVRVGAVPH